VLAASGCALAGLLVLAAARFLGEPLLAPAALAAVLALPLLVVRPAACLVMAVVVELASPRSFDGGNGVPGLYLVTLGLACVAAVVAVLRGMLRPGWSPVLSAGLLLLCVQTAAALVGRDPAHSLVVVQDTAKQLVWLAALIVLLMSTRHAPRDVARVLAGTLAVLAGLTILQEFVLGNATTFGGLAAVPLAGDLGAVTARHAGPQTDVNFWGRVLVLGLPFALSLAQMATTRLRTLLWAGAAVSILGGIVLTGSRGALLASIAVIAVWALLTGGRYARALRLAPLFLGLLAFVPGIGSRLFTLSMLSSHTALGLTDPSLQGRVAAQRVAIEMLVDHPFLGVGPGNFFAVEPEYLRRLSLNAPLLAPHNSYLEAAAEGGLLGLTAWLIFLGAAVVVAWRARLLIRRAPASVGRAVPLSLANGTVAALVGWAVASVFLHLATFRSLLVIVALAAALDIWARRAEAERDPDEDGQATGAPSALLASATSSRPSTRASGYRGRRGTAVLVTLLLAAAAVIWQAGGGLAAARVWSASASLQLVVTTTGSAAFTAYDQEALTRTAVIRTFAGITADPRFVEEGAESVGLSDDQRDDFEVEVDNTAPSGLISIIVRGPDRVDTEDLATGIRDAAARYVNSLSQLYGLQRVQGPPLVTKVDHVLEREWALVPLGLAVAVTILLWRRQRRDRLDREEARTL